MGHGHHAHGHAHTHGHDAGGGDEHVAPLVSTRRCDVAVIGGSAAGLAGALQLARQRRSVIVVDDGTPRNAVAEHVHGYLGRENTPTGEPRAISREEVRSCGGEVLSGRVLDVRREGELFRLELSGGNALLARRVLVASGIDGTALATAGVFTAGNVAEPGLQVLPAAEDGSMIGAQIASSLADEDLARGAQASASESEWNDRYADGQVWSGNPNGTLVAEVSALPPGRVLDVGAGEGGDALWLAERGWQVTASDISSRALARLEREAASRGLAVRTWCVDANSIQPYAGEEFDLVSLQYGSFARTPDGRGVRSLLDAVAPGGTLLVVSHDPAWGREPIDPAEQTRMYDPDAYVGVDDIARALATREGWCVEVHETRPRPAGAVSGHHVADVVLRAVRTS